MEKNTIPGFQGIRKGFSLAIYHRNDEPLVLVLHAAPNEKLFNSGVRIYIDRGVV